MNRSEKCPAGANAETTALAGPLGRGFLFIRTKTRALHKFQISFLNNKNELSFKKVGGVFLLIKYTQTLF